jgi:hypothetical protein
VGTARVMTGSRRHRLDLGIAVADAEIEAHG